MANIRTKHDRNFVTIANETLRRPDLSWRAKGLLAMMLTYPEDWAYNFTHLTSCATDGRDATRAAFRELERAGYITASEQTRLPNGQMGPMEYVVREFPAAS